MREPKTLKETWEKLHKSGYNSFSERIIYKHLINGFTKYFNDEQRVLDIGCGTGDVFDWLQDYIGSYYGLDISKNVVEKFNRRFLGNPKVYYASECTGNGIIPIKDLPFDVIFSCLVFQHIHPKFLKVYFQEANRLLVSDGLFMFHTTEWEGLRGSEIYLENEMNDQQEYDIVTGGVFCHKESFILNLLQENNFEIIETGGVSNLQDLLKEKATWKFYVAKKRG